MSRLLREELCPFFKIDDTPYLYTVYGDKIPFITGPLPESSSSVYCKIEGKRKPEYFILINGLSIKLKVDPLDLSHWPFIPSRKDKIEAWVNGTKNTLEVLEITKESEGPGIVYHSCGSRVTQFFSKSHWSDIYFTKG